MALKQLTESTALAVVVEDLKDHLHVTSTDEDILLRQYVKVATKQAEGIMKRQCCTAQYRLVLPEFQDVIEIPRPPLISTSLSIEYLDGDGTTQTLSSTNYDVDTYQEPAIVRLGYGQSWPETLSVENAVRISYVSGYEASTVDNLPTIPDNIKVWIMLRAGDLYEHREGQDLAAGAKGLSFVDGLLDDYKVPNTEGW